MGGTRRSTGCRTCRQRKIKCGEERPHCRACLTGGWPCPGYIRSFRFVDENPHLVRLYASKKYAFEIDIENPGLESMERHIFIFPLSRRPQSAFPERLRSMLTNILIDSHCHTVLSPQAIETFFPFVPRRLGINDALDSAVFCLWHAYCDFRQFGHAHANTLKTYGKALSTLRALIDDATLQAKSETICASIVIQYCELLLGHSSTQRYGALLRGTRTLMQKANPKIFQSEFERAMLELLRAPFIAQDLEESSYAMDEVDPITQWTNTEHDDPASTGMDLRRQLVGFLRQFSSLTTDKSIISSPETRKHCLSSFKRQVVSWYCTNVYPHICAVSTFSAPEPRSGFPEACQRNYPQIIFAFLDCVICSLICALDDLIAATEHDDTLQDTDASHAAAREVAATAQQIVCKTSRITAQHLSFGLERLRLQPKATEVDEEE